MIIVAVGVIVVAMFSLALFAAYDSERSRVVEAQQRASHLDNLRIREDMEAVTDGDAVTIHDRSGRTSRLTGIAVECDDGTLLTAPYNATSAEYNGTRIQEIADGLEAACPGGQ